MVRECSELPPNSKDERSRMSFFYKKLTFWPLGPAIISRETADEGRDIYNALLERSAPGGGWMEEGSRGRGREGDPRLSAICAMERGRLNSESFFEFHTYAKSVKLKIVTKCMKEKFVGSIKKKTAFCHHFLKHFDLIFCRLIRPTKSEGVLRYVLDNPLTRGSRRIINIYKKISMDRKERSDRKR